MNSVSKIAFRNKLNKMDKYIEINFFKLYNEFNGIYYFDENENYYMNDIDGQKQIHYYPEKKCFLKFINNLIHSIIILNETWAIEKHIIWFTKNQKILKEVFYMIGWDKPVDIYYKNDKVWKILSDELNNYNNTTDNKEFYYDRIKIGKQGFTFDEIISSLPEKITEKDMLKNILTKINIDFRIYNIETVNLFCDNIGWDEPIKQSNFKKYFKNINVEWNEDEAEFLSIYFEIEVD